MTEIELNSILYYADYLSLQHDSIPVTDTCKYYFIYGTPINMSYLTGTPIRYDKENKWFKEAETTYELIKDKFEEDGVEHFINDICSI